MKRRLLFAILWITLLALILTACGPSPETGTEPGDTSTQITITSSDGSTQLPEPGDSDTSSAIGGSSEGNTDTATSDTDTTPSTDTGTPGTSTDKTESSSTSTGTSKPPAITDPVTDTNTDTDTDTDTGSTSTATSTSKPTVTPPSTSTTTSTSTQTGGAGGTTPLHPWEQDPPEDVKVYGSAPLVEEKAKDAYGYVWLGTQPNGAVLQQAYLQLVDGVAAMKSEITFTTPVPTDRVKELWLSYRDDYPEHFWVLDSYSYVKSGNNVLKIQPSYTMNSAQKDTAQKALNNAVAQLLQGLSSNMTDYERQMVLHNRLAYHCTYVNGTNAHNAYGALVEKKAVCDGYSRAFRILCKKAGIPCLIVRGTSVSPNSGESIGHAWNMVKIGGQYYHMDVTWGDTGDPENSDEMHYAWFNLTTAMITRDHTIIKEGYQVPNCTATEYCYVIRNDMVIPVLSVDELLKRTYRNNGNYYCKVLVNNPGDIAGWFKENRSKITDKMNVYSYSFSLIYCGNEVQFIIIPK